MEARECLETRQRTGRFKGLRIELHCCVRGIASRAAACVLFQMAGVRCRIRTEKIFRAATGRRFDERRSVRIALQHRQAIKMRSKSSGEQRIARPAEMLWRDRGWHLGGRWGAELH